MIAVAGEALIDLIIDASGGISAVPGGGPFNVARTIGRLGARCGFLGRLSGDMFGRSLRARLAQDAVTLLLPGLVDAPTTLAVAEIGPDGAAGYQFYLTGTSAAELSYPAAGHAMPAGLAALHVGSLGLVMEPAGSTIERLVGDLPPAVLVMTDPNCRPVAVADPERYRDRIGRLMRRTDVVKASAEDLAFLYPGMPVAEAAAALLGQGPRLVLVTDGPAAARAFLPGATLSVPVPAVTVADTIGAGDALGGAFLAWWRGHGLTRTDLGRADLAERALAAAVQVASLTSTRAGADPPWAAELTGRPGWDWLAPDGPA